MPLDRADAINPGTGPFFNLPIFIARNRDTARGAGQPGVASGLALFENAVGTDADRCPATICGFGAGNDTINFIRY